VSARAVVVWALLGAAALVTLLCSVGVAVMRDPLQRLHFIAPPATLGSALVTIALFVDEHDKDACGKAVLVTFVLTLINGIASHATARAARIRRLGTWVAVPGERVPIRGTSDAAPPVRPEHHPEAEPS
jgi:monovalent cation/proton antiporter MnhG/PhaG subunit